MKKAISSLLASLLLISAFVCYPISAVEQGLYGDANKDRVINAADALVVLQAAVGKIQINQDLKTYLDVDANALLNATDALDILKFSVQKLERFAADKGTYLVHDDSKWLDMSMDEILDTLDHETPATPITDYYRIHKDGGLIYNPLSREMDQGDKTKYNLAKKTTGSLKLADGSTLNYSLPTDVTAYDMIPIEYSLTNAKSNLDPLYVEATTFEDKDGSYYDLCLPGEVAITAHYDGYVAATANGKNRPFLSKTTTNDQQGTQYPQYDADPLVASDTVKQSDYLWFRFTITNTGNTILDGDGNGTFCFAPYLDTVDSLGKTVTTQNDNLYIRLTEDLYPGESTQIYCYFRYPSKPNKLEAGDYTLRLKTIVRNEENRSDWGTKIWGGYTYGESTHQITIGDTAGTSMKNQTQNKTYRTGTRNTWLHTYEEFTTSFDSWLEPWTVSSSSKNTLWVQPAAWSDRVVIKFMQGDSDSMVSATIPLTVETDSINVQLAKNASNYIVTDQGTKYPAMASQSMCDMRVNISQHPDAAAKQMDELLDMKECGINIVTTTMAFNVATNNAHSASPSDMQDSNWFMCDMVKKLGMRLEGFMSYPFGSGTPIGNWINPDNRYSKQYVGFGNPAVSEGEGLRGLYQFLRWGNNYYVDANNQPVIVTEDTRGWMRIDFKARHPIGPDGLNGFILWLRQKYHTIDQLNDAWGLNYTDFKQIDPEYGAMDDHGWFNYTYGNSDFVEWSPAMNDFDLYRTLERTQNYQTSVEIMNTFGVDNAKYPAPSVDATVGIRTEGGNITGVVPYNTNKSHLRHAYYSQRRCAIIPQILAKSGVVSLHSDYVTLPYSVSEWEELVASSTALGITSMPLMQASRMRDIAINSKYTDSQHESEYNLTGENTRAAYVNTQISVFESFKAIYENGGIPGVLWEDYLCDGYVTETQQKEMKFYSSKIAEMMATDEAKTWATTNVQDVQSVYAKSTGGYSYTEEFLEAELERALANR